MNFNLVKKLYDQKFFIKFKLDGPTRKPRDKTRKSTGSRVHFLKNKSDR